LRGRTPPSTGRSVTRDSSAAAAIATAVFCFRFFSMVCFALSSRLHEWE
jgi:hypothetical protein